MNLDHDFGQVSKLSEDQKKVFTKTPKLFSPNSSEDQENKGFYQKWNTIFPRIQVDTYAQMHTRVKLLGGSADVDHTQTIGGIQSNYGGNISPPTSPGFGTPVNESGSAGTSHSVVDYIRQALVAWRMDWFWAHNF